MQGAKTPLDDGLSTASSTAAARDDYARLRRRFRAAGMLEPRTRHYLCLLTTQLALLVLLVGLLVAVSSLPLRLLLAASLALLSGQIFFLAHDLTHHQALGPGRRSRWLSVVVWNGLLGFSSTWWQGRHNAHHRNPNRLGTDPDIDVPFLFFHPCQAAHAPRWRRRVARFQAWFVLLRCMEGVTGSAVALHATLRTWDSRQSSEAALIVLHWMGYIALLVALGSALHALAVFLVHQAVTTLYITSVNALNHKTLAYLQPAERVDFLAHQLHTTRNIRSNRAVDIWCGGLNRQIEHHLFPRMPRPELTHARAEVRALCLRHGLPYREVSLGRAYFDLLRGLADVGRTVARGAAADGLAIAPVRAQRKDALLD